MSKDLENRQKRAYELHAQIGQAGKKIIEGWLEIGLALKEIRDQDYYKELGYTAFKDYCETEWNLEESYAYKHIKSIEKIPAKILERVPVLGVEIPALRRLLALPSDQNFLESLTESDLKEMAEMPTAEFNSMVSDLKKQLKQKDAQYMKQYRRAEVLQEERNAFEAEVKKLAADLEKIATELMIAKTEEKQDKILALQQQRDNLMVKVQDLEGRLSET